MVLVDIVLLLLMTVSLQILFVRGRRVLLLLIKSVIPVIGWRKTMATNCQVTTTCANNKANNAKDLVVLVPKIEEEEPTPAVTSDDSDTNSSNADSDVVSNKSDSDVVSNKNDNSNSSSGVSSDDEEVSATVVTKNNRLNKGSGKIAIEQVPAKTEAKKPTRTKSPKKGLNKHGKRSPTNSPTKAPPKEAKSPSPQTTKENISPKKQQNAPPAEIAPPSDSVGQTKGSKSPAKTKKASSSPVPAPNAIVNYESSYATTVNTPTSTGPGGTTSCSTPAKDEPTVVPEEITYYPVLETYVPETEAIYVENEVKAVKAYETVQRHAVLSLEQVQRLDDVMNEVVSVHGRGNYPTLEVRLRDLVTVVRDKLQADPSVGGAGLRVNDIRLNGGCASHVLATESQPYNDLDLIFAVELSNSRNYDKVKAAVLGSLFDLLPEGVSRKRITPCSLKEAYVSKMVKVNNDGDRWSLISLGNSRGHRNVELKFVDTMRRQFEFSVDSFQIVLDSLLVFYERSNNLQKVTETVYPTIVGESVYGDFHEAIYHLQKKLISTRHPEEIRGGGLLKYCNLLVKNYKPAQPDYIKTLERYMCSRFFIDFPDIGQQRAKLENYLWNHFVGPEEEILKYQYLMLLHGVVEESTVCLMNHERRQTLALIENLAYQVFCQEQQQRNLASQHQAHHHQQQPQQHHPHPHHHQNPAPYVYASGPYYYAPAPVIPAGPCYQCSCNPTWMACSS